MRKIFVLIILYLIIGSINVGLIGSLSSTNSSNILEVPYFDQCNFRWGGDYMQTMACTLCSCGCAVTCTAMILNYYGVHAYIESNSYDEFYKNDTNPKDLNKWLKTEDGYSNNDIRWPKVVDYSDAKDKEIDYIEDYEDKWNNGIDVVEVNIIDEQIAYKHPVIVKVLAGYEHWVVITGIETTQTEKIYYINDPGWDERITLSEYDNKIYAIRVYHGKIEPITYPPIAEFNYGTNGYKLQKKCELTVNASPSYDPDGGSLQYRWDWTNDGSYDTDWSSNPNGFNIYYNTGYYTIKLQVKDDEGDTAEKTHTFSYFISKNILMTSIFLDFLTIKYPIFQKILKYYLLLSGDSFLLFN